MLDQFNFAQLLQGENNPHSVWQLQSSLQEEGEEVFQHPSPNGDMKGTGVFPGGSAGFAWARARSFT